MHPPLSNTYFYLTMLPSSPYSILRFIIFFSEDLPKSLDGQGSCISEFPESLPYFSVHMAAIGTLYITWKIEQLLF